MTATLKGGNPSLHAKELNPQGKSLLVALGASCCSLAPTQGVREVLELLRPLPEHSNPRYPSAYPQGVARAHYPGIIFHP